MAGADAHPAWWLLKACPVLVAVALVLVFLTIKRGAPASITKSPLQTNFKRKRYEDETGNSLLTAASARHGPKRLRLPRTMARRTAQYI